MTDQRPIGFWLKLTDRLIDEQFAATLDEHGITRRQWQLLNVLARGSATVEQLDAAVAPFLEPATVDAAAESSVEHLTELIESGWVDATARGYELTDRGITALERLTVVVSEQRTVLARGITEEEYRSTIDVLERVSRNLGWSDA